MGKLVGFLALLWSSCCFCTETLTVTVDAHAPQFIISLPANPTTGFKWVVKQYDATHFNYLKNEYTADAPKRIGSGGHSVFTFSRKVGVNYPKRSKMIFSYARSWEEKSSTEQVVIVCFTY